MDTGLYIPEPCHQDWGSMQPNGQGRHCASCCKTVIDFTGWQPRDIRDYIKAQGESRVCGRLRQSQLQQPAAADNQALIHTIWGASLSYTKKIAAIVCICFGAFLSSCSTQSAGNTEQALLGDTVAHTSIQPPQTPVKDTAQQASKSGGPQVQTVIFTAPKPGKEVAEIPEPVVQGCISAPDPPPPVQVPVPVAPPAPIGPPLPVDTDVPLPLPPPPASVGKPAPPPAPPMLIEAGSKPPTPPDKPGKAVPPAPPPLPAPPVKIR